ncbi:MAG TPA: hypothetical protein VK989_16025, partial [Polyangia bacterium]|nr:hypothetical protein [Polyangia bacterium]
MGVQAKVRGDRRQRRERSRAIARQRRDERALQWAPVEYPEADRLAEPRRQSANRERPPAAGEPFLVPDYVARHRDPVVRALVARISLLYGRRKAFRTPLLNRQGGLLIPTFPELLQRPPKRLRKRSTRSKKHARTRTTRLNQRKTSSRRRRDFVWRRSDHMQAVMRVLLVLAACCDWISMEIMDPRGGYLSVARMAELAELPLKVTDPTDPEKRVRLRISRTEHALQTLRIAGILCFTKQYREVLDDGRHVST